MTPIPWNDATQALQAAERVLVVTHIHPDGDAIGSALATAGLVKSMGKKLILAVDDKVPEDLRWLPQVDMFQHKLTIGRFDLMIAVDCGDLQRTGKVGAYGMRHSERVVNIDHHPSNTMFGDVNIVVPHAVSATEILYHWFMKMGVELSSNIAIPLLTGLVTDTLGFRTSGVGSGTLAVAQALMDAGANLSEITARSLDSMPYQTLSLWRQVFPSVQLQDGIITAIVTEADANAVGYDEASDGGLVSLLNQVVEAQVAVVFKEKPGKQVNLSIRSKPGYDVGSVAVALGGGGHAQAAGATVDGTIDEVRTRALPLLTEAVQTGTPRFA